VTQAVNTRNATLQDLVTVLRDQNTRKIDLVAPAGKLGVQNGDLWIGDLDPVLDEDGVTVVDGYYRPTQVFDGGVAGRLDIPVGYLRRLRDKHIALYDTNVNEWLRHESNADRKFLVRLLRGGSGADGTVGVARAFLSDSYKPIDNLDVLMATLAGIKQAGVPVNIPLNGCDLTDKRMYVRVTCEAISALAPTLLGNYRSQFTGAVGADNPTVFAGFVISNSEVGHGAFSITPRLTVQICSNGMTLTRDAYRAQHLGTKLEEGVIRWSDDTQAKNLALVTAKTRDAVQTFLSPEFLQAKIDEIEQAGQTKLGKIDETIKYVGSKLQYSQADQDAILSMFIEGGDIRAMGVLHAVTAHAQTVSDGDLAAMLEATAIDAMQLAANLK